MEKEIQNYAQIRNLKIYYEITGSPEGDWLVLLHGMAGSTKCWKYQINEFNKHFKVLNLDMAGHGNSAALDCEKYSGIIIANYIRLLMDELGIEKAHILGISLGTIVQQYFCQLFPERIISLVFASPVCKPNYASKFFNSLSEKVFLKIFNKDMYLKLMANLMLPGKAHIQSRKFFLQETRKMCNSEFNKWWKVAIKGDHYFFLTPCDIPALIVTGNKDFYFFNDAIALKNKFVNNDFKVIQDAGHVFIFQKAEEFNQMVVEYINSQKNNKKRVYSSSNSEIEFKNAIPSKA